MREAADSVEVDVSRLHGLSIDELRADWRRRFGEPPRVRSGDFLRRCLAERIQQQAFGSDPELEQKLAALARAYGRTGKVRAPKSQLKPGAVLLREFSGKVHRVEVLASGYQWEGRTMRSLSAIAGEIAGCRWNGPAFFGLRTKSP